MTGLILIAAGLIAAALAWMTNWLALIPWRRSSGEHWTERARLYHPTRVAAASNLWTLPVVLTLLSTLLLRQHRPHWGLMLLLTAIGTIVGTVPANREVFPRIPLPALLRQVALGWMLRFVMWAVLLGAVALMPDAFNLRALVIGVAICGLCVFWDLAGWVWVGRGVGLFRPADERLEGIVRNLADQMNASVKEILVLRISQAQAFAMPGSKRLLVTERLLDLLSQDEVAAICAHELGHLTERWRDRLKRYVRWLIFLPWVFFLPTIKALGFLGLFPLTLISLGAIVFSRRSSVSLERRADALAVSNERNLGTYACALGKLYENNLLPAATSRRHATHPDLYDRLLAAGVVVDYPRPAAAKTMAWNGRLFAAALGVLLVLNVIRLTDFL